MHARQFIDTVMTQIQKQLRDERIFPTKFGKCTSIFTMLLLYIMYNTYFISLSPPPPSIPHSLLPPSLLSLLSIPYSLLPLSLHPSLSPLLPLSLLPLLSLSFFLPISPSIPLSSISHNTGYEFPFDFVQIIRRIFRQYFMILAHIYFHHFLDFRRLQLHDGLNTLFLHLVYFVEEFSLIDHKDISLLDDLTDRLKKLELVLAANEDAESETGAPAIKSRS